MKAEALFISTFTSPAAQRRFIMAASVLALLTIPFTAHAQGVINGAAGGAAEGSYRGQRAAGPVGGVVGGALGLGVGGVVGGVNGVLGLDQKPRRRGYYRNGRYYRR